MVDRNCITYWYPRLGLVSRPRTILIPVDEAFAGIVDGIGDELQMESAAVRLIERIGAEIGWPAFVRTGHGAAKHDWRDSCYWDNPTPIDACCKLSRLAEFCALADLPFTVLAAREFLRLRHTFRAFSGMPVGREYRCFIERGEIRCCHPYWPEAAIRNADAPDWRALLMALYADGPSEATFSQVRPVAQEFYDDGAWSVDVCETDDDGWYITDMAVAADSFHWPGCPNERVWERVAT